jgi:tRNA (guanine37-N1)-methyltransferase
MKFDVLTLFPDMFTGVFGHSILKRAVDMKAASFQVINFREYADNKHGTVDDYPYGGGAGMVLKPQPLFDAIEDLKSKSMSENPRVVLLCPQGSRYDQKKAEEFATCDHLIFVCGHYEGYDERIRENIVTDEISIGDFVLTGGELGAMVIIDSVVRLLPGVLGNEQSHMKDSFSTGLLEHPHYTRPANFRGMKVPDVLLSGNHRMIEEWREKESLRRTFLRRPDLLYHFELNDKQKKWLEEFKSEKKYY